MTDPANSWPQIPNGTQPGDGAIADGCEQIDHGPFEDASQKMERTVMEAKALNAWEIAARELERETGAKYIHLIPGTDPNTTVAQIKAEFYRALEQGPKRGRPIPPHVEIEE